MAEAIRISKRKVQIENGSIRVGFDVDGLGLSELWFEVPATADHMLSTGLDAAALTLLIPAMDSGRDLLIDGPVNEELVWNMNSQVIPLLQLAQPRRWQPIAVDGSTHLAESDGSAVLTGISAGVDSLNVLIDHYVDEGAPRSRRLTHLLFNEVGSHGRGEKASPLAAARWNNVVRLAGDTGLPIFKVASNVTEFYVGLTHKRTHSLRNAAVAVLFKAGARMWLYGSGYPLNQIRSGETGEIASMDPLLLGALSTADLSLHSVGGERTRVEKTARLVDWDVAQRYLDVCTRTMPNCGACEKCFRTFFTLELLGGLDGFTEVFDIDSYRRSRDSHIVHVLASDTFFMREIRDLMEVTAFRVDWTQRLRAHVEPSARRLLRSARKSDLGRRLRETRFGEWLAQQRRV